MHSCAMSKKGMVAVYVPGSFVVWLVKPASPAMLVPAVNCGEKRDT